MTTTPEGRRSSDRSRGRPADPNAPVKRPAAGPPGWVYTTISVVLLLGLSGFAWYLVAHRTLVRDDEPSWSPDSARIVFASLRDGHTNLWVMNADGTNPHALAPGAASNSHSAAWSPVGSRMAYASDRDGNDEIYIGNVQGDHALRATRERAADDAPAWAPDGRKLAFLSTRDGATPDIFLMNTDGTGVSRLTSTGATGTFEFSPDGEHIIFDSPRGMAVVDVATKAVHVLPMGPVIGENPSWSPDGLRVAFSTVQDGRAQIFTMNAQGADLKPLVMLPALSAITPRWSPDGAHIAFVATSPDRGAAASATAARGIYVVTLADGQVKRLSR
jgi:Tol biopolymer transport system component